MKGTSFDIVHGKTERIHWYDSFLNLNLEHEKILKEPKDEGKSLADSEGRETGCGGVWGKTTYEIIIFNVTKPTRKS